MCRQPSPYTASECPTDDTVYSSNMSPEHEAVSEMKTGHNTLTTLVSSSVSPGRVATTRTLPRRAQSTARSVASLGLETGKWGTARLYNNPLDTSRPDIIYHHPHHYEDYPSDNVYETISHCKNLKNSVIWNKFYLAENCVFIYTREPAILVLWLGGWGVKLLKVYCAVPGKAPCPPQGWRDDTRVVISILLCLIYGRVQVSLPPTRSQYFTRYNNFIVSAGLCSCPAPSMCHYWWMWSGGGGDNVRCLQSFCLIMFVENIMMNIMRWKAVSGDAW